LSDFATRDNARLRPATPAATQGYGAPGQERIDLPNVVLSADLGAGGGKRVENVRIENLRFGEKVVRNARDMGLVCNAHTAGMEISGPKAK